MKGGLIKAFAAMFGIAMSQPKNSMPSELLPDLLNDFTPKGSSKLRRTPVHGIGLRNKMMKAKRAKRRMQKSSRRINYMKK